MSTSGLSLELNTMLFIVGLLFIALAQNVGSTGLDAAQMWDKLINARWKTPKNREKLMTAYSSICTVHNHCEVITEPIFRYENPPFISKCPECNCFPNCVQNHDCCASQAHNYIDYACVKSVVFPPDHPDVKSYRMVATCADTYTGDEDLREKCENVTSEHGEPVTSIQTYVTYKNKFCAICNNDYQDYIHWLYEISCENDTEKPFYESFEELKSALKENSCTIQTVLPRTDGKYRPSPCNKPLENNLIDRCNISGLWDSYDPDIDWACANLNLKYGSNFKNAFCYICNPSIDSRTRHRELIDVCNVTGLWQTYDYDPDIENACLTQPMTSRLAPYKNIHCLLCNAMESYSSNGFQMIDKTVTYSENYAKNNYSVIDVKIAMRNNTLLQSLEDFVRTWFEDSLYTRNLSSESRDIQHTGTVDGQTTESTKNEEQDETSGWLLHKQIDGYLDVCGQHVCESTIQAGYNGTVRTNDRSDNGSVRNNGRSVTVRTNDRSVNSVCGACDCDDICAAKFSCCPDFIFNKQPYSSINQEYFTTFIPSADFKVPRPSTHSTEKGSNYESYLVINKCLSNHETDDLTKKCHMTSSNTSQTEVLMNIPIQIPAKTVPYRNIYCLFCNLPNTTEGIVHLRFKCPGYVEIALYLDFYDFFNVSKSRCSISFVLNSDSAVQYRTVPSVRAPGMIYKRNTPTLLDKSSLADDVKALIVETFLQPSDDYKFYWRCNQTGLYSAQEDVVQSICEGTSETMFALPHYIYNFRAYKNYACFLCNPITDTSAFDQDRILSECNVTGKWNKFSETTGEGNATFEAMCERTVSNDRWSPFKNMYCTECNLRHPTREMYFHWADGGSTSRFNGGFYRNLFSLTGREWQRYEKEDKNAVQQCQNGTFDNIQNICRDLVCANGRLLYNDTCRPLLKRVYGVIYDVTFTLKPRAEEDDKQNANLEDTADDQRDSMVNDIVYVDHVCSSIAETIGRRLQDTHSIVQYCKVSWEQDDEDPCRGEDKVVLGYLSRGMGIAFDLMISQTDDITDAEFILLKAKTQKYDIKMPMNAVLQFQASDTNIANSAGNSSAKMCSYQIPFYVNSIDRSYSVKVDKFLACPQVQFSKDEYTIDNETKSISLSESNLSFTADYFKIESLTARICSDDFMLALKVKQESKKITSHSKNSLHAAYAIFSIICTALSLFCLGLTLFTYFLFKSLRTLPGKNNMTLSAALLCAQACLYLGLSAPDNTVVCSIIGAALHFFWLSTFCAMNVCAFHMFKVFYLESFSAPSFSHNHHYVRYSLYIVLVPLLIVSSTVVGHLIASDGSNTGYGPHLCFLSDLTTLIITFITPSCIIFLSNIVFFSVAFHKIRTSPRVTDSTSGDRNDFLLYIKLCTIVGLTWPLILVDSNLVLSIFSFFVVAINASQGVFIFIAYICNRRVLAMYKARFCVSARRDQHAGKSSSGQTQTRSTAISETRLAHVILEEKL